ncbi:MAG: hypothetical protein IPM24_12095 [Bryobacterales bacterium]|nr:hypothetical protein [Bryobacterales bacterium]
MIAALGRAAWWTVPPLFGLLLYWQGLNVWFQQDDFAWLGLSRHIETFSDVWTMLFTPMAQGSVRPLSERAFFSGFYELFGLDPLPFRIAVFITQAANVALLAALARRLGQSAAVGFLAPFFWLANPALVQLMTWTSVFNQALCAFFLLTAFTCWVLYLDTNQRGYFWGQWAAFLLGFGALELNVTYPALALAYTILFRRERWRATLPLFVPSLAYAVLHRINAPAEIPANYRMHFDTSIAATLWQYWQMALGVGRTPEYFAIPAWLPLTATLVLTGALLGFALWSWRQGRREPAFWLAWFAITLALYLPLRDHVSDYYLTVPLLGLSALGAGAVAAGWRAGWSGRLAGLSLAVLYLGTAIPVTAIGVAWSHDRSRACEWLVAGAARGRDLHPDRTILLTDVDDTLFWGCMIDSPFRLVNVSDIHLAPEAAAKITPHPEIGDTGPFTLPAAAVLQGLDRGNVVVYSAAKRRLRNVTGTYEAEARSKLKADIPRRVDVANPLLASWLGPEWHPVDQGGRWMPHRATLRIAGPRRTGERLHVSGYCPPQQLERGPLRLRIRAGGVPLGEATLPEPTVEFALTLPDKLTGEEAIEIELEVDRTISDGRELGMVFGVFEVR